MKFDGWAKTASATSGTYGASPKTTTITVNVNTTLYAIWNKTLTANFYYINDTTKKTDVKTVHVTIYNGATSGEIKCPVTPTGVRYDNRDFAWAGWRKNDQTAGAATNTGTTLLISANTSFFAVYSGTLTLSYDANSGTGAPAAQTGTQYLNATATTGTANAYAKSNVTFTVSTIVLICIG